MAKEDTGSILDTVMDVLMTDPTGGEAWNQPTALEHWANRNKALKAALHDLRDIEGSDDPEMAHARADGILVGLLRTLGHEGIADAFERVPKWYA